MKLQDTLPRGVTVDGRFYKLDFDFRNVLRMMEILSREDLMPQSREYAALKCLTKHPRNVSKVINAVRVLLFNAPTKQDAKKVTDFVQDAGLIRAAFWQVYRIDLYNDRLHWVQFSELLNAIPDGSRYSDVVGIRVRPMPEATKWNAKERQWLLKAKADVALHLTDEEQEKKYNDDVCMIFAGLMNMIERDKDG